MQDIPTPRAALGYVHPGEVEAGFMYSVVRAFAHEAGTHGVPFLLIAEACSSGALPDSRNNVVADFLDHTDAEWLWCVDTDMGFGADTLSRLIDAADPVARPVVGALCFGQRKGDEDPELAAYDYLTFPTLYQWEERDDAAGFRVDSRLPGRRARPGGRDRRGVLHRPPRPTRQDPRRVRRPMVRPRRPSEGRAVLRGPVVLRPGRRRRRADLRPHRDPDLAREGRDLPPRAGVPTAARIHDALTMSWDDSAAMIELEARFDYWRVLVVGDDPPSLADRLNACGPPGCGTARAGARVRSVLPGPWGDGGARQGRLWALCGPWGVSGVRVSRIPTYRACGAARASRSGAWLRRAA